MKNRVAIKAEARRFIRSGSVSPIGVSSVIVALQIILGEVATYAETGSLTVTQVMRFLETGNADVFLAAGTPSTLATFFSILSALIISVLTAGYHGYCMGIRRGQEMPWSSLMDGFGIAGKVIWCRILVTARIFLWSMLFLLPGIVAAYRYRFAMYNLVSNDSLSVEQAIALSCAQTEGMKMDLFVLDLSFLGWELLSLMTFGILDIWRLPYVIFSDLGYYDEACIRMGTAQQGSTPPPWEG